MDTFFSIVQFSLIVGFWMGLVGGFCDAEGGRFFDKRQFAVAAPTSAMAMAIFLTTFALLA